MTSLLEKYRKVRGDECGVVVIGSSLENKQETMFFSLQSSLTFQPMFQTALQNNKKLLQWRVLRVQSSAQTQRGLD